MIRIHHNILLVLTGCFATEVQAQNNSCDSIYWSARIQLNWSDFKGTPDHTVAYKAITVPETGYSASYTSDSLRINSWCRFLSCRSWTKLSTVYLLEHERTHFDIAEYHRRLFLKKVSETVFYKRDPDLALFKIFERNNDAMKTLQEQYDRETNFSIRSSKQSRWSSDISAKIKALDKFSKGELSVVLK